MITIVSGPPCSGKNTYVKNNRQKGDVVWDFDKIHSALTDEETHNHIEEVRKYIFSMRETFYNDLEGQKDIRVWILNSSPIRSVRSELAKRLDADIVYIKRSKDECLRIAENERPVEWKSYIENYFERLEEINEDENVNIVEVKSLRDVNSSSSDIMIEEKNSYIMKNKETRIYNGNYEVRLDEDSKETRVSGYAALFDTDSRDLGFRETISKRAFDGRLEDNVILTFNHDPNLILDRNIGGTLQLSVDERGLRYDATLPNTTTGNDVAELMKRGLLYESSFAFTVTDDEWSKDGDTTRRQINQIGRLVDVSIVGVGAYANTDVALRSKEAFETEATVEETPQVEEVEQKVEESFDDSKLNLLSNELKLKKRI